VENSKKNEIQAKVLLKLITSLISDTDKIQLEQELYTLDFENTLNVSGFIGKVKRISFELGKKIEQILNYYNGDYMENANVSGLNSGDAQLAQIFNKYNVGKFLGVEVKVAFFNDVRNWKNEETKKRNEADDDFNEQNKAIEVYNKRYGG